MSLPYVIEPMTLEDLSEVHAVEVQSVPTPWPISAYRRELNNPQGNWYLVCRWRPPDGRAMERERAEERQARGLFPLFHRHPERSSPPMHAPICGFAGMWVQGDEAHVTIIGVAPAHRGRGVGEYIFTALIDEAIRRNATWITLEVRVSNLRAQRLNEKYGFSVHGTRRRYYSDDGEDAYAMSSPPANTAAYHEQFRALRQINYERIATYYDSLAGAADPRSYSDGLAHGHPRD
ncbi:MAG: ribosomal protein S18-alanine N-acetyltransferase [Thermomicrobiales bacterium]